MVATSSYKVLGFTGMAGTLFTEYPDQNISSPPVTCLTMLEFVQAAVPSKDLQQFLAKDMLSPSKDRWQKMQTLF